MHSLRSIRFAALAAPIALAALMAPGALAAQDAPVRLAIAAPVAVADAARDSAIAKLEDFLTDYPNSPLRPNALFQLGELMVRQAEEEFTAAMRTQSADTTQRREGLIKPDYAPAIRIYDELVRRYPNFEQIDAAAYTLGTLYSGDLRYADAARMFETVTTRESSRFRGEAFFRLGDAYFELAASQRGTARRAQFARAAAAYEQATQINPPTSDIYFLALYKLGWSYYNQATQASQAEYQRAVDVFGRLVAAYDQLSPEQQSRLGLRGEAIEYMAIAFTQVGGAQAAQQYFSSRGGVPYQTAVLRRVATGLRDQGDFPRAVEAFRTLRDQMPNDSSALSVQREIVDIYQNRMIEPDSAQAARLRLIETFAPGSAWAQANPELATQAAQAREEALRQAGQYALSRAQTGRDRARYAEAVQLYTRYMSEFAQADSAQQVNNYYAVALVGQGEFARAGEQFARTAFDYPNTNNTLAIEAGRNAIVAYDSALARNKSDRATQDAFFATVDRFVGIASPELGQQALIQKGRRASEGQRWDVLEQTFRTYVQRYPDDDYTPTAQKLIGDALYQQGKYAEAQVQWEAAQSYAASRGRRALADTISTLRTRAAVSFADTLIRQGNYERAAEEVYVALADKNPRGERAPGALRDAIETYLLADSVARQRGDAEASRRARQRAIELSNRLVTQYPNYQYRNTYQALAIRLTGETGSAEESIRGLQTLLSENQNFPGRADALSRIAFLQDSIGQHSDAARTYEQFAREFPRDRRAADAQFNAAVTYAEAGDNAAAATAYSTFISRFPRDERVANARQRRLGLLQTAGDTTAVNAELATLCSGRVTAELRGPCAARTGDRYFRQGASLFAEYQQERLVIANRNTLNARGVTAASQRKQRLLRQMADVFRRAIESGDPRSVAASTYYLGLAQWEYGNFLKNVQLPAELSEQERTAAQQGAERQAEASFTQAREIWQALVQKADQEEELRNSEQARPWLDRTRAALEGNVDTNPPTASRARATVEVGA